MGYDGTEGTGYRSLKEPFDNPYFLNAVGECFWGGLMPRELIQKGEFEISLGQMAFAAYKVKGLGLKILFLFSQTLNVSYRSRPS